MKSKYITTDVTKALRQQGYRLAESPDVKPSELEAALRLLFECRRERSGSGNNDFDAREYETGAAKECVERAAELPEDEKKNPLDDQDKLDEVRRRVFGSAPE